MTVYVALCDYNIGGQSIKGVSDTWEGAAALHDNPRCTLADFDAEQEHWTGVTYRQARFDCYIVQCQVGQDLTNFV